MTSGGGRPAPGREVRRPKDPPVATEAAANRAALALAWTLAVLAALRLALAFVPTTWAWGLALMRFLAPAPGFGLWAIASLALLPAAGRRAAAPIAWAGHALHTAPGRSSALVAVLAAGLVFTLPDGLGFVGDFLLRLDTLGAGIADPKTWYPQAMPIDLALHHHLARALMLSEEISAAAFGRGLGVIEAALLAWLAARFATGLGLRGIAAAAAACTVFFGGTLTLFTGYNKAFSEMVLAVAAVGLAAVRVARTGTGFVWLGVALAAALLIHRSALALVPAAALAFALGWRAPPDASHPEVRASARNQAARWAGVLLPAVALAAVAPKIVRVLTTFDPIHFPKSSGGVLATTFGHARATDLLNLLVMLSPVSPAVPAMMVLLGSAVLKRHETRVLLMLALPFLLLMLVVHAQQGPFRDWDVYAPAGQAVSLLAAWLVGETLRAAPARAWIALPLCLASIVPSVQWLIHHTDPARGVRRVEAFLNEAPVRLAIERTATCQYLGLYHLGNDRYAEAARAFARGVALLPSLHMMREWARAETLAGNLPGARDIYRGMVERDPHYHFGWHWLMQVEYELGNRDSSRSAAREALRLDPADVSARDLLEELGAAPPRLGAPRVPR